MPPWACSAPLANGSGVTAAPMAPDFSSVAIAGNGTLVNFTDARGIPCSASTDAASRYRMFLGALMAMVWFCNSARVLTLRVTLA